MEVFNYFPRCIPLFVSKKIMAYNYMHSKLKEKNLDFISYIKNIVETYTPFILLYKDVLDDLFKKRPCTYFLDTI